MIGMWRGAVLGLGVALAGPAGTGPASAGTAALTYHDQDLEVDGVVRRARVVAGFQLPDGRRWARPAGVAVAPDGAVYFTSDAGTEGLFRLVRVGEPGDDGWVGLVSRPVSRWWYVGTR